MALLQFCQRHFAIPSLGYLDDGLVGGFWRSPKTALRYIGMLEKLIGVFFGPTPVVPEGAEHRLGGLHPGAPFLASLPAAARAFAPSILCLSPVGTGRPSRTRAVSLLTGGLIP